MGYLRRLVVIALVLIGCGAFSLVAWSLVLATVVHGSLWSAPELNESLGVVAVLAFACARIVYKWRPPVRSSI